MAKKRKHSSKTSGKSGVRVKHTAASGSDKFEKIISELTTRLKDQPDDIQTRLELAEMYNATGLEIEIPKLLLDSQSKYPFEDQLTNGRFDRLLAIGYAHQKKLIEAENRLATTIKDYPDALDLWYTQCYVKLSLKDHKPAIEAGMRYLELWEKASAKPHAIGMTCHTSRHKSQLLNFLGCAYKGESKPNDAKRYFNQATEANQKNYFSYINLANLLVSLGEKEEAGKVVSSGLTNCGQVQELKMIAQILERDFTISACLMVKDEEELLPQCLESIRGWVDEIVVVDTGSTDKTIEIAKSYGAKLFHQPWEGSFSKHRNYTIEKATGDWILIIDADEEMVADDIPLLLKVISEPISQVVSINVINVYDDNKHRSVFLPSVRMFKRELGIHYDGIVHNQIKIPEDIPTLRANVRLKHYGYGLTPEKMQVKFERSRTLLLKQLDENPDHAFAHFNMGQLLRSGPDETVRERSLVVIAHAIKAVEFTDPDIPAERFIHLMALDQLAWSHFYLKEHDKAIKYCRQALTHKSDYLDPLILLGHISLDQGKLDLAEKQFKEYLSFQAAYDMTREKDNLIISHVDGRVVAWYALACTSMLRGDSNTAIEWFEKVLGQNEQYLETNAMLGELYLRQNELQLAEKFLLKQINDCDVSSDAYLWLGDLQVRKGQKDQAESSYRQALAIALDSKRPLERLIRLYSDSNQMEKMFSILENASADWSSEPDNAIALAERLVGLDRHDQAIIIYERLIRDGHTTGAIVNDLGNCYFRLNQHEKALEFYQQAVDFPDFPEVCWRNLALVLAIQERYQEASENLKKYIDISPEAVDTYQLAGDISFQLKDYSSAISHYERYLAKAVATPIILHRISDCYLYMGHKDAAILGFQRAVALDPGFEPSLERLRQLEQVVENA